MSNNEAYKYYLLDCLEQLIVNATETKQLAIRENNEFNTGMAFANYKTINYLMNQLETFDIKDEFPAKISKFNPDSLL